MSEPRYQRAPATIARELDGEVLLVPVVDRIADLDDCLFVLQDAVAVFLWEQLGTPRTPSELAARVVEEFDVPLDRAREDLAAFLLALVRARAATLVAD